MTIDNIQAIAPYNHLQIRFVKEDGTYHRTSIICGNQEAADFYGIDTSEYWTPEIIAAYEATINE